MAAKEISAVIAGGGIGGIAAAIALSQKGIASLVCEKRSTFPEEGAGIQIGPNGVRVLHDLGVAKLLKPHAASPDWLSVRDGASGRELARLPLGKWIAARHGAPYWTASRRDLLAALRQRAEAEPLVTLRTDTEIVSYAEDATGISAIGARSEVLAASVLVGADGLWSDLRPRVCGDRDANEAMRPVGKTAFRSVTASESLPKGLTTNAVHLWLYPGAHAVHYPVNGGRNIALVVIADGTSAPAGWDAPAADEIVRGKTAGFAAPLRSLIAQASAWRCWSLYSLSPVGRWTSGRAAVLGDAAHPMLPFLAQGAVMALEDAASLASRLSNSRENVIEALAAWELSRRKRVERVVSASQRNGRIYQMSGAAALARNAALKIAPAERVMAGFDWLYGWRPSA